MNTEATCSAPGCPMPPRTDHCRDDGTCYCAWHTAAHEVDLQSITKVFQRNPDLVQRTKEGDHDSACWLGAQVVRVMTRRKGDDR